MLIGPLVLVACHKDNNALPPQAQPKPPVQVTPGPVTDSLPVSYSFSRVFTPPAPSTNPLLMAVYKPDSLNYTVSRTAKGLLIAITFKGLRTGQDAATILLDSVAFKPGLVGEYAVPLFDTLTSPLPPSQLRVSYAYYQSITSSSASIFTTNVERYLPGSYFRVTGYDPVRQLITGQFSLNFPIFDPFQKSSAIVSEYDWTVKLTGSYVNLPLGRK